MNSGNLQIKTESTAKSNKKVRVHFYDEYISMSARIQNNEVIPFDMNSENLQIKTESTATGNDKVGVHFYNATRNQGRTGSIFSIFLASIGNSSKTPTYEINNCKNAQDLLSLPTATGDAKIWEIWEISKHSGLRITVEYNGVEVLNITLSDDTCDQNGWSEIWSRDVKRIKFGKEDTASKFYRQTTLTGYHSCYLNNNLFSQLLR